MPRTNKTKKYPKRSWKASKNEMECKEPVERLKKKRACKSNKESDIANSPDTSIKKRRACKSNKESNIAHSPDTSATAAANDSEMRKSSGEMADPNSSSRENNLETNIRILSVPSKYSQVVALKHPASLTLHGYVEISVLLGRVCIFGYEVKEGESIKVFSTESTGLKKVVALNAVHESTIEVVKNKLEDLSGIEVIDNKEEFVDNIKPKTVVFIVERILFPSPLQFLQQYYPNVLNTTWSREEKVGKRSSEICSTEESYTIDISNDYKMLSEEVNEMISKPVSDEEKFGPRILVVGEKNFGKSTLIRYLMNSCLNKYPMFYFLDTDLDQAEYTPSGVVSLFQVTEPLLGPPFAHQKEPLKMIFVGSFRPTAFPQLYASSVIFLMKYFNDNYPKETLFVNTMGWCQDVSEFSLQCLRDAVKPTAVIELVSPDPNLPLKNVANGVTCFVVSSKAPSKESGVLSYCAKDMRDFNLMAYFGQSQRPHLPLAPINGFRPIFAQWDTIALYVMGKKVPRRHLVEAINYSIVALCSVDLSCVLAEEFPMTLCDDLVYECLGFGFVGRSDVKQRKYYVFTPLNHDQLTDVNAYITGEITVPGEIILKQILMKKLLPTVLLM